MKRSLGVHTILCLFLLFFTAVASAQMRQVYIDAAEPDNEIRKISFYTASEGYVAFHDWIGFTQDSGRTFVKKPVGLNNVDYNGYSVNLTFGFGINGVKAFSRDMLIAYGEYGLVPAILYSSNGGASFKLVYHSQFDAAQLRTGITDMLFPQNGNTGYAVDADRVLKTTDRGLTWSVSYALADSYFDRLESVDDNYVLAFNQRPDNSQVIRTTTGGSYWTPVNVPAGQWVNYACFLSTTKGWLHTSNSSGKGHLYFTTNAGVNWRLLNNPEVAPFLAHQIKFLNDSTGFALTEDFETYKTTDSGKIWEPLPRDNSFAYLNYTHNDLQVWSSGQLWAGGGGGLLELNTAAAARPRPKAYFAIDTLGQWAGSVQLRNYSRPYYQYQWFVNSVAVGSAYEASYVHDIYRDLDTVMLVVSDGTYTDTAVRFQQFVAVPYPAPEVSAFTPASGGTGTVVTISGAYFGRVRSVSFGGIPASSFTVHSPTRITAVVGPGANGAVSVTTTSGTGMLPGFITSPPPVIHSVAPLSAPIGAAVTLDGEGFDPAPANNVVYFGSVQARVLTATPTQLTVAVPVGATHASLAVTVNHHTAYSPQRFSISFEAPCGFSGYTFEAGKSFDLGPGDGSYSGGVVAADLDGDGRSDLVTATRSGLSYARNTSSAGVVVLAAPVYLTPLGHTYYIGGVAVGDLDGDGKPDIVASRTNSDSVSLFRNTSTAGAVSFAPAVNFAAAGGPSTIAISDFDGDGKPDVVLVNGGTDANTISVYRNNSLPGALSLSERQELRTGIYSSRVLTGDMDGDGKPDIFVADGGIYDSGVYYLSLYRNTSRMGIISFAHVRHTGPQFGRPTDAGLADMDGDGKPDLVLSYSTVQVSDPGYKALLVCRNSSTPSSISFAAAVSFDGCPNIMGITLSDIDGDGKTDLYGDCGDSYNMRLMRNTGTPGTVSLVGLPMPAPAWYKIYSSTAVADLDGDGKPDLVASEEARTTFTVYRNAINEKGTFAGRDTSICAEKPVRLGRPAATQHTYAWSSKPTGFTADIADPVVRPSVTTMYYVAVTTAQGCTLTDSVQVSVGGPAPVINAGADGWVCAGDTVQIGSAAISGNTYSWVSVPAGFSSTEAAPRIAPSAGDYQFVVSVNTGSCTVKDTVNFYVQRYPVANAGPDKVACAPGGVQLGVPPSAGVTYSWTSEPAGFTANRSDPYVYPTQPTTYYLTARNGGGCTSRDTVSVAVYETPAVPVVTASGPTSFCRGDSVMLSSTANSGNQWFLNGSVIAGATGPTLVVKQSGGYRLRISNGPCTVYSAFIYVLVGEAPAAPVLTAYGATAICEGSRVLLGSSASSGNQWYKDGVAIGGATDQTFYATTQGSYTVRFSAGGCLSAPSDAVAVTITAALQAPVTTASGATALCPGASVLLSSSAPSGNQWYRNDTLLGAAGREVRVSRSGRYTVRLEQDNCVSPPSNVITVTEVSGPPVPTITANGSVLSSSAASGNQWYLNGAPINGATGQQFNASVQGQYTVVVTANDCSSQSAPFNFTVTGIAGPNVWGGEVTAYPNPVEKILFIRNSSSRKLLVQLLDPAGKKVIETVVSGASGRIDVGALAGGMYVLLITDVNKKETISQTLIKQ